MNHDLERIHEGLTRAACGMALRYDGSVIKHALDDPTPVPAGLQASAFKLAASLHHPARLVRECRYPSHVAPSHVAGLTTSDLDTRTGHIELLDSMTPASLFRVTIHECAHAACVVSGAQQVIIEMLPDPARPVIAEVIAESAAGIVTGALGVASGTFSAAFLSAQTAGNDYPLTFARPHAVLLAEHFLKQLAA